MNVTAVDPVTDGFLTVWPCGQTMPTASNVNYRQGETTPNLAIVKLDARGRICVYSAQTTGIILDVAGYFGPESPFVSFNPTRILETRANAGRVGYASTGERPRAGEIIQLKVAGRNDVPNDAAGVVVNVTGVDATESGYVTVWPCGQTMPTASNLNLVQGHTRANLVVSKLGTNGRVCIYTERGTHLIADIAGYFPAGSNYRAVTPERLLETRPAAGQRGYGGDKPAAGDVIALDVTRVGTAQVPDDASAVVLNVTATEATADGFVTVWPCGDAMPTASNLNLKAGQTAPNLVVTKPGQNGLVCLATSGGTHLIADLAGYFPATG
ncbi:MAG: hypothetical protein R2715_01725 [Ilumatobacteraceae bacterium]